MNFSNSAPYDTEFIIRYAVNGGAKQRWSSGVLTKGKSRNLNLASTAVVYSVTAKYKDGFTWKQIAKTDYNRAASGDSQTHSLSGPLLQRPKFRSK